MKKSVSKVIYYLKLLSKKWILWVSFVTGLIGLALGFFSDTISIPPIIYWIIGLVGIFWSSYQVFEEISKQIPKIEEEVLSPNIIITFVEGNEYTFDFSRKYKNSLEDLLPWSEVWLNLRIENLGKVEVDILAISNSCLGNTGKSSFTIDADMFGYLHVMTVSEIITEGGIKDFPVHLSPGQVFLCSVIIPIQPSSIKTPAQIAARLRNLMDNARNYLIFEIKIEVANSSGKIFTFTNSHKVVGRPLWDTYISRWIKLGQGELVRLAGGAYNTTETTQNTQADQ